MSPKSSGPNLSLLIWELCVDCRDRDPSALNDVYEFLTRSCCPGSSCDGSCGSPGERRAVSSGDKRWEEGLLSLRRSIALSPY